MPRLSRPLVAALLVAALLATSLTLFSATRASAYGSTDTWQIGIAGTGTAPGTGFGFGFWGWCAFGGGVTAGDDGDCQISQYFHAPAGGGFTCEESIDVTAWDASGGTFVIEAATVTVHPSRLTGPCLAFFPGPAGFPSDSMIPAVAGHYNLGGLGPGLVGEFQIQVTQIP
jgi:hypothetical protein